LELPDFPETRFLFATEVVATSKSEWHTELALSGTYDGPTDFVASRGYRLWWKIERGLLRERGMAMLERSSGELVASEWTSTITIDREMARRFPTSGQVARVVISPFQIDGAKMRYDWHGAVAAQAPYPKRTRPSKSR
jgi:hypothetical protein